MKWLNVPVVLVTSLVLFTPHASANSGIGYEILQVLPDDKYLTYDRGNLKIKAWSSVSDQKHSVLAVKHVWANPETADVADISTPFSAAINALPDEDEFTFRYFKTGPNAVTELIFYESNSETGSMVQLGTYKVDGSAPLPDPDPGGDDPDDGGTPGDGDDGTEPGDGSGGSCLCCQEVADMLGDLKDAVDNSGYELGEIKDVLGELNDAVDEQGYKLDEMNDVLHDVSDKLDTANDHLSNISDQVTPKGTYNIDIPDWDQLMEGEDVPFLDQISPVRDNNTYFSDPGQGDPVPGMPEQPDENYPVPIGESLGRQEPITAQPALSPELPKTTSPVGQPSPVLIPQSPLNVTPMQAEPIRQKDQMQADPVRQRDPVMADPVRQRTHIYERQEVPGK